jgi:lysozyme family protein
MTFEDAFAYVVGEEGGLSMDPRDRGNWTGGAVGVGQLKGTKYGVSAAAYPLLDIANLSLSDARSLAKREYWDKLAGDTLPYGSALCLFDFGYNAGIKEAVRVAQRALSIGADGVLGPQTLQSIMNTPVKIFATNYTEARIEAYQQMPGWPVYGGGWKARANLTCQKAIA